MTRPEMRISILAFPAEFGASVPGESMSVRTITEFGASVPGESMSVWSECAR